MTCLGPDLGFQQKYCNSWFKKRVKFNQTNSILIITLKKNNRFKTEKLIEYCQTVAVDCWSPGLAEVGLGLGLPSLSIFVPLKSIFCLFAADVTLYSLLLISFKNLS